ncbi:MAG: FtsQ-type POTRA domain-containing protein [Chloroflexota bacterium]|nr:FtsQ-type POTRA domain-containing protein [Chloroflexota bacterium]
MTEKKEIQEQKATQHYKRRQLMPPSTPKPVRRRKMPGEMGNREIQNADAKARAEHGAVSGSYSYSQRHVTPQPGLDQHAAADSYIVRRNQLHIARPLPQAYPAIKPRTEAVTGVRATGGRIHSIHAMPRTFAQQASVNVPKRRSLQTAKRRGNLLAKLLGILAILVLVILGANFVLASPAFRVEQVSIVGTHNEALVQHIQHMGIQGQNIFLMNMTAFTAHIDSIPRVETATLSKQWPNSLTVTITERTPALLWQTKQGTYSVDKSGIVIAPLSETNGADRLMTVVDMRSSEKGIKGQLLAPGVQLNAADVAFALSIFAQMSTLASIPDYTLQYQQKKAKEAGFFVVESRSGWMAYLGGADDPNPLENRLLELKQVLDMAQDQQIPVATVDVRYGLRPVYTLKS